MKKANIVYEQTKANQKEKRAKIVAKMARLYAGGHGEKHNLLKALEAYVVFLDLGQNDVARELLNIIVCEIKHLCMLNAIIKNLDINLSVIDLENFSKQKKTCPKRAIADVVCAKQAIIIDYESVLNSHITTEHEEVLKLILEEEKAHLIIMEKFLNLFGDGYIS